MAAAIDWGSIGTLAGVGVALLGGLIRIVAGLSRIEQQVKEHNQSIDRNARHLDSIMATLWPTIWRVSSVEDHLSARDGYEPPRLFPSMPGAEDGLRD